MRSPCVSAMTRACVRGACAHRAAAATLLLVVAAAGTAGAPAAPTANGATFGSTKCFDDKITSFMQAGAIDVPGASAAVLHRGKLVYAQGCVTFLGCLAPHPHPLRLWRTRHTQTLPDPRRWLCAAVRQVRRPGRPWHGAPHTATQRRRATARPPNHALPHRTYACCAAVVCPATFLFAPRRVFPLGCPPPERIRASKRVGRRFNPPRHWAAG